MGAYATRDDVYLLGLSAQAFVVRARPIAKVALDVDAATGTIRLEAHGFSSLDALLFSSTSGGALPEELSAFVYYTPIVLGSDLFQVADPTTGAPIVFTEQGQGWSVGYDPARRLDRHLEDEASVIDEHLSAEAPPIQRDPITGKFPQVLVGLNARMAARSAVTSLQIENPAYRVARDRLDAQEAQDLAMLQSWLAGKPINVRPIDQTTVPEMGARASYGRRSSGWNTGML